MRTMKSENLSYHDLLDLISHSKKMRVSIAYPPRLRASGEAQGEPSSVPSCLGTNKLSDTAVDRLMLHLYSISTTGEESVVLCPNHNNKVSLNDGSLRAEGQDYQLTQLGQQLDLLENMRLLLGILVIGCGHFLSMWFRDKNTVMLNTDI